MSETPRTDCAEASRFTSTTPIVPAEFARDLERELNAANERIAELEKDKARIDYLSCSWNSQGPGRCLMGRYYPNTTGSFRDAIDERMKAKQ